MIQMCVSFFDLPETGQLEGMFKLREWMGQGKKLADLKQVSDEEMSEKFKTVQQLYMAKKEKYAAILCCQLIILDHKNAGYWELFGLCMVRLEYFPVARLAFQQAMRFNIRNPVYSFYLAQTIELEEGIEKALPAYKSVLELCHHTEDHLGVRQRVLEKLKDNVS